MKLSKVTIYNKSLYAATASYAERGIPRAAGFKWSGRAWITDNINDAAKLKEFADASCKAELDAIKVRSLTAEKIEGAKAGAAQQIEEDENRRALAAQQKAEREAAWEKGRQEKAASMQLERAELDRKIRESQLTVRGDTYAIRGDLEKLGLLWDRDRKSWVAFDEAAHKAGQDALAAYTKKHPIIARSYHEASDYFNDPFREGGLLRHEGEIMAVEKAWSRQGDGYGDYDHYARLRGASTTEKASFLEMEKKQLEAEKLDEAKQKSTSTLEAIFQKVTTTGKYAETAETEGHREQLSLEGETIPIGAGKDIYGGGRWFVITEDKVWAVQNNGMDGDCWANNNIATGGAGAIGHCTKKTKKLVGEIHHAANHENFLEKQAEQEQEEERE